MFRGGANEQTNMFGSDVEHRERLNNPFYCLTVL